MSRKLKNIIMFLLIILLCIAFYFTINMPRNDFKKGRDGKEFEGKLSGIENSDFQNDIEKNIQERPVKPKDIENSNELKQDFNPENEMPDRKEMPKNENNNLKTILISIESLGIMLICVYLITSKFNKLTLKETFQNKNQIITYIVLVILLSAILTLFTMLLTQNPKNKINENEMEMFKPDGEGMPPEEMSKEKETKEDDVEIGEIVLGKEINVNEYNSNITITEPGTYTLYGEFSNTVLINANGEVTLNLNDLIIKNEKTATIANISTNPLTINLLKDTNNFLSDSGSSEYDSCIYSKGPLTITGSGELEIQANQEDGEGIATESQDITMESGIIKIESPDDGINAGGEGGTITINGGEIHVVANGDGIDSNKNLIINGGNIYAIGSSMGGDAGIDTDEGFEINGGTVIALGTDMLETPLETSTQRSVIFELSDYIKSGTELIIKNKNREEILKFTADDDFKNIIISSDKIDETDEYYLYSNGENLAEGNIE